MPLSPVLEPLQVATAALVKTWCALLSPYYNKHCGSMDLDLKLYPKGIAPTISNQFAHGMYLLLAYDVIPGLPSILKNQYESLAIANIQYLLSLVEDDGKIPLYSRGQYWQSGFNSWAYIALLWSYELLKQNRTHPEIANGIKHALNRIGPVFHEIISKRMEVPTDPAKDTFLGNIPAWDGYLLYQLGRLFDNQDYQNDASSFFDGWILPFQSPYGYWSEGKGMVVNYSHVTALAVGLYAEASQCLKALDAIRRAYPFFKATRYPDGTSSVVSDVRMRYSEQPFMHLVPGYLESEEGILTCTQQIEGMHSFLVNHEVEDNIALSLAFFTPFCSTLFTNPPISQASLSYTDPTTQDGFPFCWIRNEHWHVAGSTQLQPEIPVRWILDTQQFIEVWHSQAGICIGGGGSQYNPRFSTIRKCTGSRGYIPTLLEWDYIHSESGSLLVGFDADRIRITIDLLKEQLILSFQLVEIQNRDDRYELALQIPRIQNSTVESSRGEQWEIAPDLGWEKYVTSTGWFKVKGIQYSYPPDSLVEYPVIPFNPYRQDTLPEPSDYTIRLSSPITEKRKSIRLQALPGTGV
jgi:hypothetical protein